MLKITRIRSARIRNKMVHVEWGKIEMEKTYGCNVKRNKDEKKRRRKSFEQYRRKNTNFSFTLFSFPLISFLRSFYVEKKIPYKF